MRVPTFVLAFGTILLGSSPLAAQVWDAPSFLSPRPLDDLGGYVFKPTGGGWGIAAIWRQSGNLNLGVRAGVASRDVPGGTERSFVVGAESYGLFLTADGGSPVDASWTLGAGAAIDGGTLLRLPVGVTLGRALDPGGVVVVPYVHPRLALEIFAEDDVSETDFAWTADLGVDLLLGRSLILRVAGSLGGVFGEDSDDTALGAGVAWRLPRGVAVR